MLQICQDNQDANLKRKNGFEWNHEDMLEHQKKMIEIIMNNKE